MILKFSEEFDYPFSQVFIFCNMFPESKGFVAVPVTRSNNFVSLHYLDKDKLGNVSHTACNRHNNGTATLRKHNPNIKTCEHWWSNFSENLRIVALKLLELNWFWSPNQSIYSYLFNFVRCLGPLLSKAIFRTQSINREVYSLPNINVLPQTWFTFYLFKLELN